MGVVYCLSVNSFLLLWYSILTCNTDGGGIGVFSQIVILREISNRIKHDLGLEEWPPLCNYFDMIGGVGTGG